MYCQTQDMRDDYCYHGVLLSLPEKWPSIGSTMRSTKTTLFVCWICQLSIIAILPLKADWSCRPVQVDGPLELSRRHANQQTAPTSASLHLAASCTNLVFAALHLLVERYGFKEWLKLESYSNACCYTAKFSWMFPYMPANSAHLEPQHLWWSLIWRSPARENKLSQIASVTWLVAIDRRKRPTVRSGLVWIQRDPKNCSHIQSEYVRVVQLLGSQRLWESGNPSLLSLTLVLHSDRKGWRHDAEKDWERSFRQWRPCLHTDDIDARLRVKYREV